MIARLEKSGELVDLVGHDWSCILTARVGKQDFVYLPEQDVIAARPERWASASLASGLVERDRFVFA